MIKPTSPWRRWAKPGTRWRRAGVAGGQPGGLPSSTFNEQAARRPLMGRLLPQGPDWLRPLTKAPLAAISYCSTDLEAHAFTLGGLATRPSGGCWMATASRSAGCTPRAAASHAACRAGARAWQLGLSLGIRPSSAAWPAAAAA